MNFKFGRSVGAALGVCVVFCLGAVTTPAQPHPQSNAQFSLNSYSALNGHELENALEATEETAEVFRNIAVARNEIPQDVLRNAAAIGVFEGIFNLAFIGGHRQGNGAISVRTPSGWSAPVFYKMRGGFGLEPDASPTHYLLVFMSRESINDIAGGEFDLDHHANALAGPIMEGPTGAFTKSKTVFVYSRGNGALTGAVIDGVKLTARDSVNLDLYGANALALLSDPLRLPDMCASCLEPSVSDYRQPAGAAIASQQAYSSSTQPRITIREDLASNATAPHKRGRGVKVIVIKIINEDDDDDDVEDDEDEEDEEDEVHVVAVRPQLQPAPVINCCPRVHRKKH
jgi:lipid-binding SYLF domain-containing protein